MPVPQDLVAGFNACGVQTPDEDVEFLVSLVRELQKPFPPGRTVKVAEIGSWTGRTAIALAQPWVIVYCIDHWQGTPGDDTGEQAKWFGGSREIFKAFCKNVGHRLFTTIFPCVGDSEFWAMLPWPFGQLDMVFIDGDHSYDACFKDISLWRPLVRPGGILCGHDYGLFDGVTQAVNELVPDHERGGRFVWWTNV